MYHGRRAVGPVALTLQRRFLGVGTQARPSGAGTGNCIFECISSCMCDSDVCCVLTQRRGRCQQVSPHVSCSPLQSTHDGRHGRQSSTATAAAAAAAVEAGSRRRFLCVLWPRCMLECWVNAAGYLDHLLVLLDSRAVLDTHDSHQCG